VSVAIKSQPERGIAIAYVTGADVDSFWEAMLPKLEIALEKSHNEVSAERVREMILAGHCMCWLATDSESLLALAIGEPMETEKGFWLNIPFAWVDSNLGALNRMMDAVEEFSVAKGWRGVKFSSSVESFGSWAARRGYSVRFIEYVKVLNEGA